MAEQVGPAREKPITTVAFEAGVIDWLPSRGFHHGPGLRAPTNLDEAEGTFAVRFLLPLPVGPTLLDPPTQRTRRTEAR